MVTGVGLGLLERALMGLSGATASALARAAALPADLVIPSAHLDPNPGYIGTAVLPLPGALPDAFVRHGLAVPGIKPEDSVGIGNDMPALDIGERAAVRLPGAHVLGAQFPSQRLHLNFTEGHHLVLTEMVMGGFPRTAPGMSRPLESAEISPMRSSLAGCGLQ